MSFDDEGGEPRTQRAPRRRATASAGSSGVDDQTLLVRRVVAGVGALLLLILLVVAVRSYLGGRRDAALRSYNATATAIADEAQSQVSQPLFTLLANPTKTGPIDAGTNVNSYRVTAEQEAARARGLSVPGEMVGAQRDLLLALDLRAEALQRIADNLPGALGTQNTDQPIQAIAAQMQALLGSDVIYSQRVAPLIRQALAAHGINAPVTPSQFLPDISWLSPKYVRARLTGSSGGSTGGQPKSGTNGDALNQVSVGGQILVSGTTVNRIKVTPNLTFNLFVANQGSNDEPGVLVSLEFKGASPPIQTATKTIDTVAMTTQHVLIPVTVSAQTGTVRLVAKVATVPGETDLSNNSQSFIVQFTP